MISVVIPLYNKKRHISQALESVLSQKVKPIEIIVVDDGSTDDGAEIVRRYHKFGVRLICQINQGVSAARNRGLHESQADYIAFLDADDYWLPNHLEVLSDLIHKYPNAVLLSTLYQIKRYGKIFVPKSVRPYGWEGMVENFFKSFASGLSIVHSSTACVKRRVIIEVGAFPVGVKRGEDIIAWTRLALKGAVAHKAVDTAVYNQEADNRVTESRDNAPPGSLVFLAELLRDRELSAETLLGIAALFDRIALMTAAGFRVNGDISGARRIAELAIKSRRIKTALLIGSVLVTPKVLLQLAKKYRLKPIK